MGWGTKLVAVSLVVWGIFYFYSPRSDHNRSNGYKNYYASTVTDYSQTIQQRHPSQVALYSTAWRGYCKQSRALMKRRGIAFVDYDIERSHTAHDEYSKLGGHGIPLLLIEGQIVRGYDEDAILPLSKS